MKANKAQLKISFGMLFSIILIVIFISVAFYAIYIFIDLQKAVKIGKFTDDLQFTIDNIWKSGSGSTEFEIDLPNEVEEACITDFESSARGINSGKYSKMQLLYSGSENLFLYPYGSAKEFSEIKLEHIDLQKSTLSENPLCIKNGNKILISMDFGESLVTLKNE
jgi:hypothetical protein